MCLYSLAIGLAGWLADLLWMVLENTQFEFPGFSINVPPDFLGSFVSPSCQSRHSRQSRRSCQSRKSRQSRWYPQSRRSRRSRRSRQSRQSISPSVLSVPSVRPSEFAILFSTVLRFRACFCSVKGTAKVKMESWKNGKYLNFNYSVFPENGSPATCVLWDK